MSASALFAALMTVVSWGGGTICDKLAVRDLSPRGLLLARSLVAATVIAIWGGATGSFREIATAGWVPLAWVVAASLLSQVFGQFMYYRVLKIAPASQVVPITATYPLVTVALAILLLGEKMTGTKMLGVVCIAVGIMLVSGLGRNGL